MRFQTASYLVLLCAGVAHAAPSQRTDKANCRFVQDFTQSDILEDPSGFLDEYLYWESKFHVPDIAYNPDNGMTYDGSQIDWTTGLATTRKDFSASSKEVGFHWASFWRHCRLTLDQALQLMIYAQVIAGHKDAARFVSPDKPSDATGIVVDLLEKKYDTYIRFNDSYPGFGGMLPWILSDEQDISPQDGWNNRIPGLDNGYVPRNDKHH